MLTTASTSFLLPHSLFLLQREPSIRRQLHAARDGVRHRHSRALWHASRPYCKGKPQVPGTQPFLAFTFILRVVINVALAPPSPSHLRLLLAGIAVMARQLAGSRMLDRPCPTSR
ncbi:hypothetical protein RJ55_04469 [Drechmeria coniospora]|nr:hypothetical protein RJ55_04469 [Drechmeria coniospora]